MFKANIYIGILPETSWKTEKSYGYVITCRRKTGEEYKVEGFGKTEGTKHETNIRAIIAALERFNQSCEILIHSEDAFVLNMINNNLEKWAGNDFKTAKGIPVESEGDWRELYRLAKGQLIKTIEGKHPLSGQIKAGLEKRTKEEKR